MRRNFLILFLIHISSLIFGQDLKSAKITEVERIIAESKTPLIVNMWATWCVPCVRELPYFQEEVKKYKKDSVQLLLVSLDFKEAFPDAMTKFMDKRKINGPVLWLDETNADYFCPKIDATWSGAIPATLFINNRTGYRKFVGKALSQEELEKEVKALF